jgi:hypothetical protein
VGGGFFIMANPKRYTCKRMSALLLPLLAEKVPFALAKGG